MSFPFASWERPQWRSEFLPHASLQLGEYLLQLVAPAPAPNQTLPTHKSQLFFRSLESGDEGSFIVTYPCFFPFHEYQMGIREFRDLTVAELGTQLDEALTEGNFARVFFLNAEEQLRRDEELAHYMVVVGATGWGKWTFLKVTSNTGSLRSTEDAAFKWTDAANVAHFLSTPALEIWASVEAQRQDVSSDCAFARRVLDIPNIYEPVLLWNQSQHTDLHRVLEAALLSHIERWEGSKSFQWIIKLDKLHLAWHRGELIPLPERYKGYSSTAPDELRDVLRRVSPYFTPLAKENLLAPHLEIARRQTWAENPLRIWVENPTAHERLETALFWEEWQQAHPITV